MKKAMTISIDDSWIEMLKEQAWQKRLSLSAWVEKLIYAGAKEFESDLPVLKFEPSAKADKPYIPKATK